MKIDSFPVSEIPFYDENDKGDLGKISFARKRRSKKFPEPNFKFSEVAKKNHQEVLLGKDPKLEKWDLDFFPELERDAPDDWISPEKLCIDEELENIDKNYNRMQEKIKQTGFKKKKLRRKSAAKKQSKEKDPCFLCKDVCGDKVDFDTKLYIESSDDDEFDLDSYEFHARSSERKIEPIDEGYYQSKLAKLYLIELGIEI